ncbi:MAG TPA: sulfurtransferase [Methanotrichaceae archaeon]|nr:sulfurtransferase [Methanotrichaceae archaeon]
MRSKLAKYGAILIVVIALASIAQAGCSCRGGGEGTWDGPAWAESTLDGSSNEAATVSGTEAGIGGEEVNQADSDGNDKICSPAISAQKLLDWLGGDSKPLIVYVTNTPPKSSSYIDGSILLPSRSLIQADGSLKPLSDLAEVLGNAGITEDDDLVIYGDCFSCGDDTFVFWAIKYLGHQKVQILQGTPEDWAAAGLPKAATTTTRPAATYSPDTCPELLADYDSVAGGEVQVVDARSPDQFAAGHIDGATNIDYNRVIEDGWIKDDSALTEIFGDLDRDRPVAVYTKNGGRASIVWYALQNLGYDARLYTWNDWLSHQS